MKYFGWIPNLRGRLSFSTIGTSTKPYPFNDHVVDEIGLISQNRYLNDTALPRSLRIIFFGTFSPFRFLFWCAYFLSGIIFPSKLKLNKSKFIRVIEKLLYHSGDFKFIFVKHNKACTSENVSGEVFVIGQNNIKPINSLLDKQLDDCSDLLVQLKNLSVIYAKVALPRNGLLEIYDENINNVSDDDLNWVTRGEGFIRKEFEHNAVSQVYYFMKDLCHQHQHHDSKSDILLPLIKEDDNCEAYKKVTEGVLKSLYRTILKMRRTHTENDYYSMKGMMAYVSSFKAVMRDYACTADILKDFSDEGDNKVLLSVEAKAGSLKAVRESKNKFTSMMPSIMSLSVASLGLIFAFSSVMILALSKGSFDFGNLESQLPTNYISHVLTIINNPIEAFLGITTIFIGAFFYFSDWFNESKFRADAMRLVYSFNNKYIVGILIVLPALWVIYISYQLLEFNILIQLYENLLHNLWQYFFKALTIIFYFIVS
jgi:hypothetical protein